MTEAITECPQCGFTDFDEMEICQACGFLSEDTSVRNISFGQVVRDTCTRLQEMGFYGDTKDSADFDNDPALFDLPGGSMYFTYHGHEDFE